jgi:hypothetical protein
VLEHPAALERLLASLDGIERLVLLGDVVELLGSRPRRAFEAALPILERIGARLGADREVVVVPGNHDRPLIRGWLRAPGRRLDPATLVPADASPRLAGLVQSLAPARVEVRYPGVWLGDGGYALHGHYLDRHLWPVSAYGVLRDRRHLGRESGESGREPGEPGRERRNVTPMDYERTGRVHLSPVARWLPGRVGGAFEELAEVLRASTMPRLRGQVLRPEVAPMTSRLLSLQMRRHSLPAIAQVIRSLGVAAEWVVFGHVHRLGPLPEDEPARWMDPDGAFRLLNTGSWLYEPRLVHRAEPPHPYWPGGAVLVEPERPGAAASVRAVNLLDDLPAEALRPPSTAPRDGAATR